MNSELTASEVITHGEYKGRQSDISQTQYYSWKWTCLAPKLHFIQAEAKVYHFRKTYSFGRKKKFTLCAGIQTKNEKWSERGLFEPSNRTPVKFSDKKEASIWMARITYRDDSILIIFFRIIMYVWKFQHLSLDNRVRALIRKDSLKQLLGNAQMELLEDSTDEIQKKKWNENSEENPAEALERTQNRNYGWIPEEASSGSPGRSPVENLQESKIHKSLSLEEC